MSEERKSRYELFIEEEARQAQPTKRCSRCGETKALSEFHRSRSKPQGVMSACKDCRCVVGRGGKKYKSRTDRFWKFFWSHVVRTEKCLEWNGMYKNGRVPAYKWHGKQESLRRIVYRLAVGELPDDQFVLMTCRNRRCVSQFHMKLGSDEDLEAYRCMSMPAGHSQGERNPNAKVTPEIVREIRAMVMQGTSQKEAAALVGISSSLVNDIVHRRRWAHVQ